MIRDHTDFVGNGVGIDPPDCGCTDCLVGNSVNLSDDGMTELANQALRGRRVSNRTGAPLVLMRAERQIIVVPDDAPDKWRFPEGALTLVNSRTDIYEPKDVL